MNKRIFTGFLCLLVAGLCFAGGAREDTPTRLDVSYVISPFNLPQIVMKQRGMLEESFKEIGIEVVYHEINSGAKQSQAMAAGSLDIGGVMNSTSVLLARGAGNNIEIISAFSRPVGIFSIVASDPSIKSAADLAGKKVAGPKGTVLHQLLAAAMESEGLSMDDLEFLQMGLPQASSAMLSGHVDAALLAGSLAIRAEKSGAHIVLDAEGLISPKLVICAREGFADSYPELVQRYIECHRQALAWMREHLDQALEMGAAEQGISLEEARILYERTRFADSFEAEDIASLQDDIDFMLENRMLSKAMDPKSCFASSALSEL